MSLNKIITATLIPFVLATGVIGCGKKDEQPTKAQTAASNGVIDMHEYNYPCTVNGKQVRFYYKFKEGNGEWNILEEVKANGDTIKYWSVSPSTKVKYVDIIYLPKNENANWFSSLDDSLKDNSLPRRMITYHNAIPEEQPLIQKAQVHQDSVLAEMLRQKVEAGYKLMK